MIYKRGKVWWTKIKRNKKVFRKSTGTINKTVARDREAEFRREIADGLNNDESAKKRTLLEMIERFEKEYLPKRKYPARDRSTIKHLKVYFGEDTLLTEIEKSIGGYESFRTAKGVVTDTVLKELKLLGRMCNLAIKKWKWIKESPLMAIDLPKSSDNRVRYLSEKEKVNLFQILNRPATPKWLKPIVITALLTGLRQSNLLNMKWNWVNLFAKVIYIGGENMKNKENLGIPLPNDAVRILKELHRKRFPDLDLVFHDGGKKIYPVKLQRAFRKARNIADIADFRFHDLRHSYASSLRQRGVDLHTIQKLLGHKDGRMTQRYAHLAVENLRNAVAVLDQVQRGTKRGTVA